ncbi:MAG: hypothetical protein ABEH90_03185 [Halolamina sp.]
MATASPSSEPEGATLSGNRGQTSPTAALVAAAAIGMGITLHAIVLTGVVPVPEQEVAGPTLDRVDDAVVIAGVADPKRLDSAAASGPTGYRLRVNLRADGSVWSAGATRPEQVGSDERVQTAERRVAVRTAVGRVRAGRLRVEVWR